MNEKIRKLIDDLSSPDEEIQCRAEADLIYVGKDAVDLLIDAADSPNPQVRYHAVWALGKIGDNRAYSTILKHTKDDDSSVSYDSIMSLGELGDAVAIEPLIDIIRSCEEASSNAAATALVKFGKKAVRPLVDILLSGSSCAKLTAVGILGGIGDSSTIGYLVKLMIDPDEQLRIAAIEALARMGEEHSTKMGDECLRLIEERLKDESDRVSETAIYWSCVLRQALGLPQIEDE